MNDYSYGFMPNSINQNTFNDFNRIQCQQDAFSGSSAKLFLFTPQMIPVQVARPFVYQFTPDFVEDVQRQVSLDVAVGPKGNRTDAIRKAILPDDTGMVLNTSTLSTRWTFVMIIDNNADMVGSIIRPGTRQICMGYCSDEPFGINGAPNPSCVLIFTHNTIMFINRTTGPTTPIDGFTVYPTQDVDYANDATNYFYNDKVLLGTPREIMQHAVNMNANPGITDYSSMDLNNVKGGNGNVRTINNNIKAPIHQLSDIMSAIGNSIEYTTAESPVLSSMIDRDELTVPPNVRAFETAGSNMPSSTALNIHTGIDTSQPMPILQFEQMFPNAYVQQYRVRADNGYGWDVTNQAAYAANGNLSPILSMRNQMCFLASTVIQSICGSLGITNVAFSYMWLDGDGFIQGKKEAFMTQSFDLTVPRPESVVKTIHTKFKAALDDQLFDIIHALAGEFEIHILANMGGDILVDLKMYNFPDPQDGSYYQTSARFGSIMNPMIGDVNTINNNVVQLSNVTQALVGSAFNGVAADQAVYGTPMMPSL